MSTTTYFQLHGHAVVIGASIAGLLAARELAAHFRRVTIIERGALPERTARQHSAPRGPKGRTYAEHEIRDNIRTLRNVAIIEGTVVTQYLTDWEDERITGIRIRGCNSTSPEDVVDADLIVDTGGRSSQTGGQRRYYEELQRTPIGLLLPGDTLERYLQNLQFPQVALRRGGLFSLDALQDLIRDAWRELTLDSAEHSSPQRPSLRRTDSRTV